MGKSFCSYGTKMQARVVIRLFIVTALIIVFMKYEIKNWQQKDMYSTKKWTKHLNLPYNISRDTSFDYKKEMEKLNQERVKADDPRLIHLIRNYFIEPPSERPYNLTKPGRRDSSFGQAMFVDGTLKNMEDGFFVDSGAHDGEIQSNTLFFERIRGWTGILIEPQPKIYQKLKGKERKSFTLNACVSVVPYPSTNCTIAIVLSMVGCKYCNYSVKFLATSFYGKLIENVSNEGRWTKREHTKEITVQCFPLYSILLAMNQLSVDYFSLDVEGAEEGIISNIPFDKIKIRTISIEYDKVEGGADRLRKIMGKKGFKFLVKMDSAAAHDCIFYR